MSCDTEELMIQLTLFKYHQCRTLWTGVYMKWFFQNCVIGCVFLIKNSSRREQFWKICGTEEECLANRSGTVWLYFNVTCWSAEEGLELRITDWKADWDEQGTWEN